MCCCKLFTSIIINIIIFLTSKLSLSPLYASYIVLTNLCGLPFKVVCCYNLFIIVNIVGFYQVSYLSLFLLSMLATLFCLISVGYHSNFCVAITSLFFNQHHRFFTE